MTPTEVGTLCRYIKAQCPSQAMDEYTADVWADDLPPYYSLDECQAAVIAIKQRQTYVDVSDVITQVKRTRRDIEERGRIRTLLDPAAHRRQIEAADQRTLELIRAYAGNTLAIEGPPRPRREYIGPLHEPSHPTPQDAALRQAEQSRAARQAREAQPDDDHADGQP